MNRRSTVTGMVSLLVTGSTGRLLAQPAPILRVGWLAEASHPLIASFREGMAAFGYIDGVNLAILERYSGNDPGRLAELAGELANSNVKALIASGGVVVREASRAGTGLPIIFAAAIPTLRDSIASFARPGGNISGIALLFDELAAKWPELMHAAFPRLQRFGVLGSAAGGEQIARIVETGKALGIAIEPIEAPRADRLAAAIDAAADGGIDAMIVTSSPVYAANRQILVDSIARRQLPAIYEHRAFVDAGGLMSYGPDMHTVFRRLAWYAVQVTRGARIGELPIEQPSRFEFIVNLKSARAQGLDIAPTILGQADEVIE